MLNLHKCVIHVISTPWTNNSSPLRDGLFWRAMLVQGGFNHLSICSHLPESRLSYVVHWHQRKAHLLPVAPLRAKAVVTTWVFFFFQGGNKKGSFESLGCFLFFFLKGWILPWDFDFGRFLIGYIDMNYMKPSVNKRNWLEIPSYPVGNSLAALGFRHI